MKSETASGAAENGPGRNLFFPGEPHPSPPAPTLAADAKARCDGSPHTHKVCDELLGDFTARARELRETAKRFQPLQQVMVKLFTEVAILAKSQTLLFQAAAEARGFATLHAASRLLPGYSEAVASYQLCSGMEAWSDIADGRDLGLIRRPQKAGGTWHALRNDADPLAYLKELAANLARLAPEQILPALKNCDIPPDATFEARMKKIEQRAKRRADDAATRSNAASEPMLYAWIPAALWLCDEGAGAVLLNRFFRHLGTEVFGKSFGTHRRSLKPRLWWRKPAGIVLIGERESPRLTRALGAELAAIGVDVRAVKECLAG